VVRRGSCAATLELLLKQGPDPNARNDAKATALMWAATDLEKTRVSCGVQQYDFPDKNFINKVYTHRLNELFAESAPQLIGILGLVMLFAE
jgi:ankyrin repeat protein